MTRASSNEPRSRSPAAKRLTTTTARRGPRSSSTTSKGMIKRVRSIHRVAATATTTPPLVCCAEFRFKRRRTNSGCPLLTGRRGLPMGFVLHIDSAKCTIPIGSGARNDPSILSTRERRFIWRVSRLWINDVYEKRAGQRLLLFVPNGTGLWRQDSGNGDHSTGRQASWFGFCDFILGCRIRIVTVVL